MKMIVQYLYLSLACIILFLPCIALRGGSSDNEKLKIGLFFKFLLSNHITRESNDISEDCIQKTDHVFWISNNENCYMLYFNEDGTCRGTIIDVVLLDAYQGTFNVRHCNQIDDLWDQKEVSL